MKEMNTKKTLEKVLIVGLRRSRMRREYAEASLDELSALVETADGEVVAREWQDVKRPNPATFIGKGKVEEIAGRVEEEKIDLIVFDDELSPAQNRNLSMLTNIKVLDRTAIILDIFAKRAHTKDGRLQVELAQLKYRLTRLSGQGLAFSQQAGYIGNRGPGETKLEVDRRRIRERISRLKRDLDKVRMHREIHRKKREAVPVPTISLVGYTNAGKSTLLNAVTGSDAFVEDKLFATLDPTVRKVRLKSGREILIADTVGFIRRLPHQLIDSFRATFEEVALSDLLIHLVDITSPDAAGQIETVERVLKEFDLQERPRLMVFNKCDIPKRELGNPDGVIEISAMKKSGIGILLEKIDEILLESFETVVLKLPYSSAKVLDTLYQIGNVRGVIRKPRNITVKVDLDKKHIGKYSKYIM